MSGLKNSGWAQGLHEVSTTQKERLGALRIEADGRKFRYAKAGDALGASKNTIAAVQVANHINRAVAAAFAIGVDEVSVPVGATAVTADQYAGGFLDVNDATGEGHRYRIASNTACDASGTTVVKLEEPIRVALVASTSEVSLIPSKFNGITNSAVEENESCGAPLVAVASGSYCWVQTGGDGLALMAGTPAVGSMLTGGAVAGSLAAINATLDIDQPVIARKTMGAGVDTEYKPVCWMID